MTMVYQQHNDLCTPRTPAKKSNHENGCVQVHKPDTEVTEEMNGDTAADKDGVMALATLSDDLRLEVTCGQNQAVLYTSRLQLGSKGTCVLFENAWLTPNEFQYVSGRETAKDWKRSIKHHGKSLKVLIAKGILSTTPPARCNCSQCITSPVSVQLCETLLTTREAAAMVMVFNFGRVCLSVCQTITFESLDVGTSYLHIRYISRECGTGQVCMKVIGSASRSQEQKSSKISISRNVKLRSAITPIL